MIKKLEWDAEGKRLYETGVNQGVLYVYNTTTKKYAPGVAWNGLTNVSESPEGAEATDLYADNQKYLSLLSAETFKATVEAYTYPDEFAECDGSAEISTGVMVGQQPRKVFGLSYKTVVGNDVAGEGYGYKLHLIYGCKASPSEKTYATINDSPEAITFSWSISTTPVNVTDHKATATLILDSTKVSAAGMAAVEAALYGTETEDPYLPLPDKIVDLITAADLAAAAG